MDEKQQIDFFRLKPDIEKKQIRSIVAHKEADPLSTDRFGKAHVGTLEQASSRSLQSRLVISEELFSQQSVCCSANAQYTFRFLSQTLRIKHSRKMRNIKLRECPKVS